MTSRHHLDGEYDARFSPSALNILAVEVLSKLIKNIPYPECTEYHLLHTIHQIHLIQNAISVFNDCSTDLSVFEAAINFIDSIGNNIPPPPGRIIQAEPQAYTPDMKNQFLKFWHDTKSLVTPTVTAIGLINSYGINSDQANTMINKIPSYIEKIFDPLQNPPFIESQKINLVRACTIETQFNLAYSSVFGDQATPPKVVIDVEISDYLILWHQDRIYQLLYNLLLNSRSYIPNDARSPNINLSITLQDSHIHIAYIDNSDGYPQEAIRTQHFSGNPDTSNPSSQSVGLNAEIASLHHFNLLHQLTNPEAGGSQFIVIIPSHAYISSKLGLDTQIAADQQLSHRILILIIKSAHNTATRIALQPKSLTSYQIYTELVRLTNLINLGVEISEFLTASPKS